jgi:LCP family protein required for cell wall assembly
VSVVEPPVGPPKRPLDHRDATYYQIPRRRRPVLSVLMWSVIALLGIVGASVLFAQRYGDYALSNPDNQSAEVTEAIQVLAQEPKNLPDRPWNILVIGSDTRGASTGDGGRSDTLILVRLDFKRGFISMLSFPRDLYVSIPGYGQNRINSAYSFGSNKLAIETVEQLTGESIDHFFNVDFNAFVRLVNDAGGVYLDIDRWYFNDNSGPGENFEQLDIKPGYQKLKGAEALDYVRYRHGDSDFARIARQQAFLSELKRQSRSARGLDNIVDAIHDEVTTSLRSTSRLKDFLLFALETEKERIARVQVKTTGSDLINGQSVVLTSQKQIRDAVDQWKNPEFISQAPAKPAEPSKVIVNVYNGSKRLRLGAKAGEALATRGYKVFVGGNAPDGFYQSTSIFYAPGKRNEAKALQQLFGDRASIVARRKGQPTDADVLVMIGSDYEGLVTPRASTAKPVKTKPDILPTTSLKRRIQNARAITGLDMLVPIHLPRGYDVAWMRLYNVERGDQGKPNALTIVLRARFGSTLAGNRYVTITQTGLKNPPIIKTRTGVDAKGCRCSTFYNGRQMHRLLWQRGNMTYWISNSLDEGLTDVTIRDMQQFMVRPAKAKLRAGQKDTAVSIEEKSRTP